MGVLLTLGPRQRGQSERLVIPNSGLFGGAGKGAAAMRIKREFRAALIALITQLVAAVFAGILLASL